MIETEENKEQEEDLSCLHLLFFPISEINNGKIQSSFLKTLRARVRVCAYARYSPSFSLLCCALP